MQAAERSEAAAFEAPQGEVEDLLIALFLQHEGRRLVAVLLHEEADDPEGQHDHDVPHVARLAVHADHAEQQDSRIEEAVRHR